MSTFVAAMPSRWQQVLLPALADRGHTVIDAQAGLALPPGVVAAATIDLRKALRCVEPALLREELDGAGDHLGEALAVALGTYTGACAAVEALSGPEREHCVLVTTCTYDVPGRALAAAAADTGRFLVHLAHACQAGQPDLSWYAGEVPGDWLLVPGQRDAEWWAAACAAQGTCSRLIVTGHPLWDAYATMTPRRQHPPLVVWLAESGAHPTIQLEIWRTRHVPCQAWSVFLRALRLLPRSIEWRLCLKTRLGEDEALLAGWTQQAEGALPDSDLLVTNAPLQEVLPEATIVVGQDSNGLVEAAHLGIPCINITRRGGGLFTHHDAVWMLDGEQESDPLAEQLIDILSAQLGGGLVRTQQSAMLRAMAGRYNAGAADGQSLARVVAVLEQIAADPRLAVDHQVQQVDEKVT